MDIKNKYDDLSIENLQVQLKYYLNQKIYHLKKTNECIKNENKIIEMLKKKCKHMNTEKHKDSGPYPETHIFCIDCSLYL